ncbi:DUF427 domain-containing protein [Mesorhizobium australicum]|uniref:Uncharacterized conserved protein, DUF427 family n=1 Tax=Mesorhizobium australicum TaxID=536018 RepID=A0A1X7NTK8_9HYPH|nr:DUF427 domain-containing protein [Mesorhizobium australicum]SMH41520.1 Uncharacterized conserved protein, DUF427 family [Mesorhizobium australicum]
MTNPSPGFARNPAKSITVEPYPGPVTVSAGGKVIARTARALKLTETPYPPVLYIPFADIDFSALEKTTHASHCPYKGDASYWSVTPAGPRGDNAMWAYERPYDEMAAIRDHGAFYPDRVTIEA